MKVLVWTPDYRLSSGGVRLMHYLCHCLNEVGYKAYTNAKITNPDWNTPYLEKPDDDTIVIYPEIVSGNPLQAKYYVYYMLNIPGKIAGDKVYPDDIVAIGNWPFWEDEFRKAAKNYKGIITLGLIDTNVFYYDNAKKFRNLLFIYKGGDLRSDFKFENEDKMELITGKTPLKEFSQMLKETETLYTYDEYSGLNYEAYLCGCKIMMMGKDGVPFEWKPDPEFLKAVCRDDEKGKKQAARIMEIILKDIRLKELLKEPRMNIPDYHELDNELNGLHDLIDKYVKPDFQIIEIGSFMGASTELFALHCENGDVISIDPYTSCEDQKGFVALEKAEEEFVKRMGYYTNVTKIKKTSKEASKEILDKSIDLVYIDANHSYGNIVEDINLWLPKVKENGYIAGHDYALRQEGVFKAVRELLGYPETFSDSSWIIRKRDIKMTLFQIADKYGCDKSPKYLHNYIDTYSELLEPKKNEVKKVLEIGIGFPEQTPHNPKCAFGASIYMWRDYFPNAEIYAIDIDGSHLINEDRIHSFLCDQRSEVELKSLVARIGEGFDLIIDDGSHN